MNTDETRQFQAMQTSLYAPSVRAMRQLVIALSAVVVILALFATPSRAAERARLEAFLAVTGFDVALESIKLSAESAPEMLGVDPGVFGSDWTRLSEEVFDVPLMHEMALDILEQTLTDALLLHAAEFYASDLGQRLVAVENASHMNDDDIGQAERGREIVDALVRDGSPRIQLFNRMSAAIDSADTSLRALQEIQYRFLTAASAAGVLELRVDPDALRALLAQDAPRMRQALRASALTNAAMTYEGIDDTDLRRYTEALEQPRMKEVYVLMNAVQFEVMANRFEVLAARMGELQPGQEL